MSDFYEQYAETYFDLTVSVDPTEFLEPLVRHLPPEGRVLDVGCGSGRDLLWLRNRGFRVMGVERSPALAELAKKHVGCEVAEGDFESWDFAGNQVDGLLLVGALVHIPHEALRGVLSHIICALAPQGKVLLTLKEGEGTCRAADGRVFYLWQDCALQELLANLGFQILHFARSVSAIRKSDTWLTYVLEKVDAGRNECLCPEPGRLPR